MSLFAHPTNSTLDYYYLYKNPNAFNATVLSNQTVSYGNNPFVVEKKEIKPVSEGTNSSRVALAASIAKSDG